MTNHSFLQQTARLALRLAFLATLGRAASAQLPAISGGAHVRLSTGGASPTIDGTVFSQSGDSLQLVSRGLVVTVPTSAIERLEVAGGRSHSAGAWHGAAVGSLIGLGAGTAIFGAVYASYDGEKHPSELVSFIASCAFSGAFYGAIIGGAIGRESWAPVYAKRLNFAPVVTSSGAAGVGIGLKF